MCLKLVIFPLLLIEQLIARLIARFILFFIFIFCVAVLTDLSLLVSVSVALLSKPKTAEPAFVGLLTLVHAEMIFHIAQFFEISITNSTN